jgi:hypothetical protein
MHEYVCNHKYFFTASFCISSANKQRSILGGPVLGFSELKRPVLDGPILGGSVLEGPDLGGPVFYLDGSDGGSTKSLKQAGFRNDDLYSANLFQDTVNSLQVKDVPVSR